MRISLEWISDFVDLPSVAELCERLMAAGVEVESIGDPAAGVQGVVVALVRHLRPHPEANRLQICEVFDGQTSYQVVCGAPNVAVGMRVAFARVGGWVPGPPGASKPLTIGASTIRGTLSQGMLCSRAELGLESTSDGLWPLPERFTLGADVLAEAALPVILQLSITPNRPDLLCHLGVAREVGASTQRRTKPFKWRLTEKGPDVGSLGRILVEEPGACRRYVGRVVRGLKVGPSPAWLKDRLESIGQRSINNVVDATNYVMHELGQPLHAFDLSRIAVESGCPTLRVRRALQGEVLRTLDGVERHLAPEDLVIADPNRPVALAGVMGGADVEVRPSTVSVLLESACFDPAQVRQLARRYGLRTEASQRFERGVDVGMVTKAVDRCAQILADVAEGEVAKGMLEVAQKAEPTREIPLRLERIARLLGIQVPTESVVQLLEPLEIRCVNRTDGALIFQVPSFRADISREVDLIEEIARRHGYERIAERMPAPAVEYQYRPQPPQPQQNARQAMLACGLHEAVNYGFGSIERYAPYNAQEGPPLTLLNPLGEEMRALRTTLIPGLMQVLQHNGRQGLKQGRFFEVGTTFHQKHVQGSLPTEVDAVRAEADGAYTGADGTLSSADDAPTKADEALTGADGVHTRADSVNQSGKTVAGPSLAASGYGPGRPVDLPREDLRVSCVLSGERHQERWYGSGQGVDATDVVGLGEALLDAFAALGKVTWVNCAGAGYNPLCSAQVRAGDVIIGHLGQVDPERVAAWDLSGPVYALEFSLTALVALPGHQIRAKPLPRYPKTRRDLAVICAETAHVSAAALQQFIVAHAGGALGPEVVERVWLFDRYTGTPLQADETSLAFAIDYRSRQRTLLEGEVADAFSALLPLVAQTFGVHLRSQT